MEKIASFTVDHLNHPAGIYLSRIDGDAYTYDVRICTPYKDELLTNAQMHSLEHLLATILRNGENRDKFLYVGPMGCQTGFYVIYRNLDLPLAAADIISAFESVVTFDGVMPGNSKQECGNCLNLSLSAAKEAAELFLKRIGK